MLFLRWHRVGWSVALVLSLSALLVLGRQGEIRAGWDDPLTAVSVPLAAVLPAAVAFGVAEMVRPADPQELMAVRRLWLARWAGVAGALILAGAAMQVAACGLDACSIGIIAVRNLLGLTGGALALMGLLGPAASLVPVLFSGFVLFSGASADGTAQSWAWTLHPGDSPTAAAVPGVLVCAGLLRTLRRCPGWQP